ncbi:ExeM/NucH family extracellular endonuclease [Lewinella sp. IMCC34183]|uniref:ExeM/NucH family extracellular endonuclease n=1 Tax=Lewinella sp. IMCC34183 TaxID=2248762 RepID=UPI000E260AF1|nr:ExeM/NucH family extracellular endonuclease [Lewinella sp. IMCC34183]
MNRLLLLVLLIGGTLPLLSQRVILTGIMDGDAPGGLPKAIELYVEGTADLGAYTVLRYSNGGSSGTPIALSGTHTDRFVYLINSSDDNRAAFAAAFGSSGDFADPITSGSVSGNGNDLFELRLGDQVIDQTGGSFGDDSNVYQDGYLYRIDNTGPTPVFDRSEWTGGNGLLDGLTLEEQGAATPFGTYVSGPVGPSVSAAAVTDLAEPATDGAFSVSLSRPAPAPVTITYTLSGTASEGVDYTDPGAGSITLPAGQTSATLPITVIDDEDVEGEETIELTITGVSDATYAIGSGASIVITDNDLFGTILISTLQGDGFTTPLSGETVTVEAVVTGTFPGGNGVGLRGFYVQEEESDYDADPATSEGVFVFSDDADLSTGDLVKVTGQAGEFGGQTQLSNVTITLLATGLPLPEAVTFSLPAGDTLRESLEGMRVAPTELVVTDNFNLARFGEISVTSGERLIQFTECNEPDAAALAEYTAMQQRDVILVDDGRNGTNGTPILLPDGTTLSADNTLRAGQTVSNLVGILGEGFNTYRIQPTETEDVILGGNVRPTSAPEVGGEITVVSANVLNYFTTLGSRGADTQEEFERQQAKIVNALCALDGDIVGLIEIENNDYAALENLIAAIAATCGTEYAYVESPNTGDDQIMVALIYQPARVAESGTAAALATPAELFVGPGTNRVPLAQTFRVIDPGSSNYGQELTVSVNHFKSKGSGCGDDAGDGSGNCNTVRDAAARALTEWLATNPTGVAEEDVLIIGDLNSYRMEDPIMTILDAGYFNTKVAVSDPGSFPCGGGAASYGFQGQWGSLDYVLATNSLSDALTGAATWGVNSAEPAILDYNTEGLSDSLYAPDFYRFSDHDPLIVGLDLGPGVSESVEALFAQESGNKIQLKWKTIPSITADYIAVERQTADGTFVTIGTVQVSGGNSNGNRTYVFNDTSPLPGRNVYRLRVVESDGTARYSNEVTAMGVETPTSISRVSEQSYRVNQYGNATYSLVSMSGQVVRRGALNPTAGQVTTRGLPTGIYVLQVLREDGSAEAVKVMVR